MVFGYLEAVYLTLKGDEALSRLVDGYIEKFKPQEEFDAILRKSRNQSLISVEVQDFPATARKTEPAFLIDIFSRKSAEQCLCIADRVRELLKDEVSREVEGTTYSFKTLELEGKPRWDKKLLSWRLPYRLRGFVAADLAISSLISSLASPQKYGEAIRFVCVSPQDGSVDMEFRFLLSGPRTGQQWANMTGWRKRNHWTWIAEDGDIGESAVKVEIRHFRLGLLDIPVSASVGFTINDNSPPAISALAPNPPPPYRKNSSILWICTAADADGDSIQYKFWLSGPRNSYTWQDMTGWQTSNYWNWATGDRDVGTNSIKVQVRDLKHAGASSFDDEESANFEVTAA